MYSLTNNDELNCIMEFKANEFEELKTERLNAFKKRCKKIKQKLGINLFKYESLLQKEFTSANKQRLFKLSVDLEKGMQNTDNMKGSLFYQTL